jgi:hypothetical protein
MGIAHRSHDPADRHQVTPQREHGRHEAVDQLIQHDIEQEPGAVMGELGVGLDTLGNRWRVDWWDLVEGDQEVLPGDQVELVQPGRLALDRGFGPVGHQQQVLLVLVDLGPLMLMVAVSRARGWMENSSPI